MSKNSYSPSEDNFICTDYLALKPEKASLFDLVRLLWSPDEQKHGFIESPQELEQELRIFRYRWILLFSILMQKLLRRIRTLLAIVGFVFELWVNLVSNNGGPLKLLINFITGMYLHKALCYCLCFQGVNVLYIYGVDVIYRAIIIIGLSNKFVL